MKSDTYTAPAHPWVEEFPGAITVCDPTGIILEMNAQAALSFQAQGGRNLLGRNMDECHSAATTAKLRPMMAQQQANTYTVEKNGVRKLVHQAPWYRDGQYAGYVEFVFPIPAILPNIVRQA